MVAVLHQHTQLQGGARLVRDVLPDDGQGERGALIPMEVVYVEDCLFKLGSIHSDRGHYMEYCRLE